MVIRTCSSIFRQQLASLYPGLEKNASYWLFLHYLAFPTILDESSSKPVIPAVLLASLENKTKQLRGKNYNGEAFLKRFRDSIQYIEWSKWESGEYGRWKKMTHLARIITKVTFSNEMLDAIDQERNRTYAEKQEVYVHDGKPVTKSSQEKYRLLQQNEALLQMKYAHCQEERDLLEYMNRIRPLQFRKAIGKNLDRALDIAKSMGENGIHDQDILSALISSPQPFYCPTGGSVRIYAKDANITYLSSAIRRALTKGWIECDLKNAQLSIAATVWDIPEAKAFLETGQNIWDYLFALYGIIPATKEERKEWKSKLKDCLYAFLFGAQAKTMNEEFKKAGLSKKPFLTDPLINAIHTKRNEQIAKIQEKGHIIDAFGRTVTISKQFHALSLLAQQAQSYELKLLHPIIQLAKDCKENPNSFDILIWQHDGYSWRARKRTHTEKQRWTSHMKTIVENEATKMGIPTELEATTND